MHNILSRLSLKILNILCNYSFVRNHLPDKWFLIWQWLNVKQYKFNWKSPKTVNEKIMWLKLHDRNPLYTTLVDKNKVKQWISDNIGNEMLIKTYFVYDSIKDINLEALPNQFVLKCNHDSGNVFICYDKSTGVFYDKYMKKHGFSYVKEHLAAGMRTNYFLNAREWPYKNVDRKIIAEELILTKSGSLPNDYKLFYINGSFQFVYVSYDRAGANDRCTYGANWERLPFVWVEPDVYRENINTSDVPKPLSFPQMLSFSEKVAKYFKIVRIDLYDVDGKMYFGEITPFHSAGYASFFPNEYDMIYGDKIKLD